MKDMKDITSVIKIKAIFDLRAPHILPKDKEFGRLSELTAVFGIGKDRFIEWRQAGKLPAIETSGTELYSFAAVLWWLIETGFVDSGKAPGSSVVGNNGDSHPAPREAEDAPGLNYEMASIFVDDMIEQLKKANSNGSIESGK